MDKYISLLVSLLHNKTILRVAVKIEREKFINDCYLEQKNKQVIYNSLPSHCQYLIIEVCEIFETVPF